MMQIHFSIEEIFLFIMNKGARFGLGLLLLCFFAVPTLGQDLFLQNLSNHSFRSGSGYSPSDTTTYTDVVPFDLYNAGAQQHYTI